MKKILITAGPTWIKVDEVRILTSIFSGNTGIFLARNFKKKGYKVTLLVNSPYLEKAKLKGIKILNFRYFDDFKAKIIKELKSVSYDTIIHSAAVSDYKLAKTFEGKLASGRKSLALRLLPAEKIIKLIRKLQDNATLVQFKLEVKRKALLAKAFKSLCENNSDFVVANALEDLRLGYKSFLIDRNRNKIRINSKKTLFNILKRISDKS